MKPCVESWLCLGLVAAVSACSGQPAHRASAAVPASADAPRLPVRSAPTAGAPDPEQRFAAALTAMKDGDRPRARVLFDQLAADYPQFSGPLTDLGVLQARSRDFDAALASFAKAVAVNDRNAFAWSWLGLLYRSRGDDREAEQAYLRAIALAPEDAVAHFNLGILYDVYLHRPADALRQYRAYVALGGPDRLIVEAWIHQLGAGEPTRVAESGGAAP